MRGRLSLLERTFRASANFALVPYRRLGDDDKQVLGDLTKDPEFFGLLEPRRAGLGVKSVSHSLASLIRALSQPGTLPARVRTSSDTDTEAELLRLVLDSVLEIEHQGRFASGAAASHLFPSLVAEDGRPTDPVAILSHDALRYGESLQLRDPTHLSARLYFHNRKPVTPTWAHRLSSRSAVLDYLNVSTGGEVGALLDRYWTQLPGSAPFAWVTWKPREQRDARSRDAATHKLYVSPTIDAMPDAFRVVVRELAATAPMTFKVGGDVAGLMRPDKMVLYFPSRDALERVSYALTLALDGMPAHGVPFTSAIGGSCLLSQGVDPPRSLQLLSWRDSESWRLWVTNRLAAYMLTARATRGRSSHVSERAFALARIRMDGVDTDTWAPHAALWNATAPHGN